MKKLIAFSLTLFYFGVSAQKNPTQKAQPIVEEGEKLYHSEMASWYGTDLFIEAYENRENIGGYFSYMEDGHSKCIFFSSGDDPLVIGTISFDSTYIIEDALVNLDERAFTSMEKDLYTIRYKALELINEDTLFKTYNNTRLNLIPLINGNDKKVYVITGPNIHGVVIFGNDYLISFNKKNEITDRKVLHKNIIPIKYDNALNDSVKPAGAMHSHLPETGEYITATDICTLMLYSKFAGWESHSVVSKEYLNIWDCKKNTLVVIPNKTMKKISEDSEKRKSKDK